MIVLNFSISDSKRIRYAPPPTLFSMIFCTSFSSGDRKLPGTSWPRSALVKEHCFTRRCRIRLVRIAASFNDHRATSPPTEFFPCCIICRSQLVDWFHAIPNRSNLSFAKISTLASFRSGSIIWANHEEFNFWMLRFQSFHILLITSPDSQGTSIETARHSIHVAVHQFAYHRHGQVGETQNREGST